MECGAAGKEHDQSPRREDWEEAWGSRVTVDLEAQRREGQPSSRAASQSDSFLIL